MECYEKIGKDMDNINRWLKINKSKLNENKTKLIEINMHINSLFRINNVVIERVKNIKYLGFIMDSELKLQLEYIYVEK